MSSSDAQVDLVHKLFLEHSCELRGFLLALLPDIDVAGDLLHEVFLVATAKADTFTPGSNFVAWIKAIARLKALEAVRTRRLAAHTFSPEVIESLCGAAPDWDVDDRRLQAVRTCVERLSPRARTLIDLRYRLECKPAEIARRVGWKSRSVSVELSRARDALRECVQRKLSRLHG